MNCQICGRTCAPGAKMCPDCRAARKRAFDATVTQPLFAAAGAGARSRASSRLLKPSRSAQDAKRRAAKEVVGPKAQPTAANDAASLRAKWPIALAAMGAIGAALLIGAYVSHRMAASTSDAAVQPPAEVTRAPESATTGGVGAAAESPLPASPSPNPIASSPGVAEYVPPAPLPTKSETAKRQAARTRIVAPPAEPPAPTEPPPQAVAVAPPPPVVREIPRPDPWQPMNDAIARCPRDDIPGRGMCEQRLRAQYCEGKWGLVPQCASMPYIEHGQ